MTVTELLTRHPSVPFSVQPDRDGYFSFPSGIGVNDPFLDGARLHAGLELLNSGYFHGSRGHVPMWPVLTAVQKAALSLGAERIVPEVKLERSGIVGRVDLRTHGKRGIGHIEIKVVASLPDKPRERDLCQLAHYVALERSSPDWTALVYLKLQSGCGRYFSFDSTVPGLVALAHDLCRG